MELVARLDSAEALYAYLRVYNWDDGFEVPTALAAHPCCDLGVALALFWKADALSFTGEFEPSPYNRAWVAFSESIANRILNGGYEGSSSFEPQLGKVTLYKLRKRGVPEILLGRPGDSAA